MALVAVQQPGQRETQLDAVAKALNIAQSIYGIKTAREQMQLANQREARADEMAQQQMGIQQGQYDIVKQKADTEQAMLKTGSMTPKQFNDEYFEVNQKDVPLINSRFQGLVPVIKAKVWKYGAKEGEPNYEERIAIPRDIYSKVLSSMSDERKTQMLLDAKAEKTGKGGLNLTPGQEKLDKEFAALYDEWTSGGHSAFGKNVDLLERSKLALENEAKSMLQPSGRFVGQAPNIMRSELSKRIEADVRQSAQGALKATLGAAFGEKEGERIMRSAYDATLSPKENLLKIQTALNELYGRKHALDAKIKYFENSGTLQGFVFDPSRRAGATGGWGEQQNTQRGSLFPSNNQGRTTPSYTTEKGRNAAREIGIE